MKDERNVMERTRRRHWRLERAGLTGVRVRSLGPVHLQVVRHLHQPVGGDAGGAARREVRRAVPDPRTRAALSHRAAGGRRLGG